MKLNNILLSIFFILSLVVYSQEKKIDKLLEVIQEEPGIAAAVYHNGKYIYTKTTGKANLDYETDINANTVFEVGSLAMHITASCILKLEDDKKISLNDDIRKYLDDLPSYKEGKVTINHLLNHTSGIMDYLIALSMSGKSWNTSFTNSDAYKLVKLNPKLGFTPGQEYEYSNSNYMLLSEIISRVSGTPHHEFAKIHLFKPLGMLNTFYYNNPKKLIKNRAIGYEKTEQTYEVNHNFNFTSYGSGRLYTTLNDLMKWAENLKNSKLSITNLENRLTKHGTTNNGKKVSYALGLEHGVERSHAFYAHSGYWTGFSAMFLKFPKLDLWVIALSNNSSISAPNKAYDIAGTILDKYPKESEKIKKIKVSKKKLKQYEGHFIGFKNGYLREIKMENDTLNYIESENRKYKLLPIAKHKFKVLGTITNYTIDFQLDSNNHSNSMKFLRNGYLMYSYEKYRPFPKENLPKTWNKYLGVFKNEILGIKYELKKDEKKGIDIFVNGKKLMNYLPVMNNIFASESTHHGYLKFSNSGGEFVLSDYSFKPIQFKKNK